MHKLIAASADRNTHVFTSAVSTDLCTQLLNIAPGVHRQHLPQRTWTPHFMSRTDIIRVGFLWVWADPLSCPSIPLVCFISYTDICSPPLHSPFLFLQLLLCTMQNSTISCKKHTHFPRWGWNCPKLYPLHNAAQAEEKIWINPPPPILAPIPSRCKIFLIGIASKTSIKADKVFIPYLSKDLSSPAGEQMETGNPAALLSSHYQLFT